MSEISGRAGGPREEAREESDSHGLLPDARGGRWLRRHIAGSVAALTTVLDGGFRAATLTGWLLVSVDPVQVAVSIEVESQMESWLRQSGVFGLSVLPWSQQFLADRFAGRAPLASRTFAGIDHFTSATGAPLLTHSVGWVDCRITDETETGDHVLFFGEALAVGRGADEAAEPLMYYFNQYRHFR